MERQMERPLLDRLSEWERDTRPKKSEFEGGFKRSVRLGKGITVKEEMKLSV